MRTVIPEQPQQQYKRIHSFSSAPSIAQIASYFIFISQALLFYIFLFNSYENSSDRIIMICLFTTSLFILILFTIFTGQLDPTDSLMIAHTKGEIDKILKFRDSNRQDILFCQNCKSYVKKRSKHCRACNRCIEDFDHHCIWLNTCVGSKNYRQFFVTIILAFLNMVIFVASTAIFFDEVRSHVESLSSAGFILTVILAIVIAVFIFLIVNLIILHIYLMRKGLTTYDYIILKREQQKRIEDEKKKEAQIVQVIQQNKQNLQDTNNKIKASIQDENEQDENKTEFVKKQWQENKQLQISGEKSYQFLYETSENYFKKQGNNLSQDRFKDQKQKIENRLKSQKSIVKYYLEGRNSQNQRKMFSSPSLDEFGFNSSNFKQIDENPTSSIHSSGNFQQIKITKKKNTKAKINTFFMKNLSLNWIIGNYKIEEPIQNHQKSIELDKMILERKQERTQLDKKKGRGLQQDSPKKRVSNKQRLSKNVVNLDKPQQNEINNKNSKH